MPLFDSTRAFEVAIPNAPNEIVVAWDNTVLLDTITEWSHTVVNLTPEQAIGLANNLLSAAAIASAHAIANQRLAR